MNPKLIAMIPSDSNCSIASHQIWRLADTTKLPVLLLSLGKNESDELELRRGLVTMSALLQGENVPTDMKIETGTNWVDVVKLHYQPGDMIVCFAEHQAGIFRKPLAQILETKMDVIVYVLSDPHSQKNASNWRSQILVWLGLIGLLTGFGILQLRIVQLTNGFQSVLLILSTILEFWLFGVWNNRFH